MAYTFGTDIEGDIASVRPAVEAALAEEGFGVLTEIDVSATLKAKLNVDRDPYLILGACNPALANDALNADANVGALLPCNVVLRQEGSNVAVRFMDPITVLGLVDAEAADEAAHDARSRLSRVSASLGG